MNSQPPSNQKKNPRLIQDATRDSTALSQIIQKMLNEGDTGNVISVLDDARSKLEGGKDDLVYQHISGPYGLIFDVNKTLAKNQYTKAYADSPSHPLSRQNFLLSNLLFTGSAIVTPVVLVKVVEPEVLKGLEIYRPERITWLPQLEVGLALIVFWLIFKKKAEYFKKELPRVKFSTKYEAFDKRVRDAYQVDVKRAEERIKTHDIVAEQVNKDEIQIQIASQEAEKEIRLIKSKRKLEEAQIEHAASMEAQREGKRIWLDLITSQGRHDAELKKVEYQIAQIKAATRIKELQQGQSLSEEERKVKHDLALQTFRNDLLKEVADADAYSKRLQNEVQIEYDESKINLEIRQTREESAIRSDDRVQERFLELLRSIREIYVQKAATSGDELRGLREMMQSTLRVAVESGIKPHQVEGLLHDLPGLMGYVSSDFIPDITLEDSNLGEQDVKKKLNNHIAIKRNRYMREICLSDNSSIQFYAYPLNERFNHHLSREDVDPDLINVLLDVEEHEVLQRSSSASLNDEEGKVFLGFSSSQPDDTSRLGLWMPSNWFFKHLLIAGPIGSGKTILTNRLIAGAWKNLGTVVVGEAKRNAFEDLAMYLSKKFGKPYYRWPNGNCWFNPLIYLKDSDERRAFFEDLAREVCKYGGVDGDLKAWVMKAGEISSLLVDFMYEYTKSKCTLRTLDRYLDSPSTFKIAIETAKERRREKHKDVNRLEKIERELSNRFFFKIKDDRVSDRYTGTLSGIQKFRNFISKEDLLKYSEPEVKDMDGKSLQLLDIDYILKHSSLVVISQPLDDTRSYITAPLFWDILLKRILELPRPKGSNDRTRQPVTVFLDETNRLPTGKLGSSGDIAREFNLGLVEILPTIGDIARWNNYQKSTYQTFILVGQGCDEVNDFVHSRLANQSKSDRRIDDNPGVTVRSITVSKTGRFSAKILFQDSVFGEASGLFWLDLESELFAEFTALVADARTGAATNQVMAAVDYALGLSSHFYYE
jgi:hypothetical protein